MNYKQWIEDPADLCGNFQQDLSCLVDGELEESAGARAMVHIEECSKCSEFLEDIRLQAKLHKDVSDPSRLFARISLLTGASFDQGVEEFELVHRLATIFYQLGKAYVLIATDPGYTERLIEKAVAVEPTQTSGRGFVDGVLLKGQGNAGNADWGRARHFLNGRLERIESPLEKGRRLLTEALEIDPSHEEARLYVAYLSSNDGKLLKASRQYRDIFNTAIDTVNRGIAAIQLGRLYSREDDFKKAIACFRWITISGLADMDDRFFVVRFNLGGVYARMGDRERSLNEFRTLLDKNPERVEEIAGLFARSTACLLPAIESQEGFAQALYERCPELFGCSAGTQGTGEIF